ncbi:hypothetical protein FEP90_05363 [Burkholderia multivorans]|nr:hypothetical protein [Burkholderia multivorans]MDR8769448.1 hypothetical protein [Burkholderia multivorans]MDR8774587.1 hypothetical protein [Burkholderia multivorans]MDR8792833.1 hypothetical protein [Burkholderia multivorans]MDR8859291.1 hypothetical protein [Burkholderia multivorans]
MAPRRRQHRGIRSRRTRHRRRCPYGVARPFECRMRSMRPSSTPRDRGSSRGSDARVFRGRQTAVPDEPDFSAALRDDSIARRNGRRDIWRALQHRLLAMGTATLSGRFRSGARYCRRSVVEHAVYRRCYAQCDGQARPCDAYGRIVATANADVCTGHVWLAPGCVHVPAHSRRKLEHIPQESARRGAGFSAGFSDTPFRRPPRSQDDEHGQAVVAMGRSAPTRAQRFTSH